MPNERAATDKLTAYAAIETEQARHVREAAEAIFNPQQRTAVVEGQIVQSDAGAATKQQPGRAPRILTVSQPQREPAAEPVAKIPASKHGRIRALATYGMTIAQIADVYAVTESEIERIVGKPTRLT